MIREWKRSGFWRWMSEWIDRPLSVLSPDLVVQRQASRLKYDVLDKDRLRPKRKAGPRAGDADLSERTLDDLRQIARDLSSNNPLVKGLFRKIATNVVGTSTRIQARTADKGWNEAAEQAVKAEMIDVPCDVTGRFNFHAYIHKSYYRYIQDGDVFTLFHDYGPEALQGECCGTPYGAKIPEDKLDPKRYTISNGVVFDKETTRIVGYFLGKPNKWGYIQPHDWHCRSAERVHHMFDPERFDQSRGEPKLTSAVPYIDYLFNYIEAELVAAKINACFPIVAKTYDAKAFSGLGGIPASEMGSNQKDDFNREKVKIQPGTLIDAEVGESYEAIGAARPAAAFDPFVMRMLMFVGGPLCLPLMLTTGDFSHATFMNGRFAYNEARAFWRDEQELVVRPLVRRLWLWKIGQLIDRGKLKERDDWAAHQIYLKRWPYVDPYREAQADKIHLENGTTTRTEIVARQDGLDWAEEVWPERVKEEETIRDSGIVLTPQKQSPQSNGGKD